MVPASQLVREASPVGVVLPLCRVETWLHSVDARRLPEARPSLDAPLSLASVGQVNVGQAAATGIAEIGIAEIGTAAGVTGTGQHTALPQASQPEQLARLITITTPTTTTAMPTETGTITEAVITGTAITTIANTSPLLREVAMSRIAPSVTSPTTRHPAPISGMTDNGIPVRNIKCYLSFWSGVPFMEPPQKRLN